MQLPPPGLSKLTARTYHPPAPAPAPAQRQPAPAGASGRATADEPDGRGDEQQREREQPAALDPLERPEPAVGLVSGQLGVAVLDEVAHGGDAGPGGRPGLELPGRHRLDVDRAERLVDHGQAGRLAAPGPPPDRKS